MPALGRDVSWDTLLVSQDTSLGISCSVIGVKMSRNALSICQNLASKFVAVS